MRTLALALVALVVLTQAGPVAAHGERGATVDVVEQQDGGAVVTITTAASEARLAPRLDGCEVTPRGAAWHARCPGGLGAAVLGVDGLGASISEAVVRVARLDGRHVDAVLTPAAPTVSFADPPGAVAVARRHVALGLAHIARGLDHLIFLVLLVLYARELRANLWAETAFAVAHGLTFAATSQGWLHVASAPAEACIALSLVLLALDVGRARPVPAPLGLAALAFVFGAVHGLGFAGGLRELGVPDAHAAWALVGFGLGVELGQLAVVLVAAAAVAALRRARVLDPAELVIAYAAGAVATAWLIQRTLASFPLEVS